jgi:hypothetical protein
VRRHASLVPPPDLVITSCAAARSLWHRSASGWPQGYTRTPGFRQADRDGLFAGAGAMLALTYMVHFFADKFAGLRRWGFAFSFIAAGAGNGCLVWHNILSVRKPFEPWDN